MKLAICPGHTQNRPGAKNRKYKLNEHQCALHVVRNFIELAPKDWEVQTFIGSLRGKVQAINSENFDLAIDVHFNADPETEDADNTKGHGCGVVYYPKSIKRRNNAQKFSGVMAQYLGEHNIGAIPGYYWGGKTPGKKLDYFTSKTRCPSFITEQGFIDNNAFAEKFLLDETGYYKLATALIKGIEAILNDL